MPTFVKSYRKKNGVFVRSYTRSTILTARHIGPKATRVINTSTRLQKQLQADHPDLMIPSKYKGGMAKFNSEHPKAKRSSQLSKRFLAAHNQRVTTWEVFRKKWNKSYGKSPARSNVKKKQFQERAWKYFLKLTEA